MNSREGDADAARRAGAEPSPSAGPAGPGVAPTAELRAVINAMPEAVFVCDKDGRIRLVNPAANALFADAPIRDRADFQSRFVAAGSAGQSDATMLRRRDTGQDWYELRSFPIGRGQESKDGGTTGTLLVLRDVTAEREERAERHAFLSVLSHELRTPITTIYAGSRVLARREAETLSTPATREIAADISAEAARLYDVVEDLLVLTRVEQGLLELSQDAVLLPRVVEAAVRVARARATDAPIPIVVEGVTDPPAVRGDTFYIEQVVRNLVTAAARFATPSAPVLVRIDAEDDEVCASVLDRGPDLTTDDLRSSFSLNDAPRSERRWGLGIALFVCRRLVEAMNGRIWVRPRDGGGAEFGFALRRYVEAD